MFLILPVSYEIKTDIAPKKVARKLDHDLTQHRPTMNIMSNGRFMRNHKYESCFYGCRTGEYDFQVYHHKAKKRDGGTTGFYGTIVPIEDGCVIRGSFRKPLYTYIVAVLWTVVTIFLALVLFALKEKLGSACMLGAFAVGIFIMFWDSKKPIIKAYIDSFAKRE